MLGAYKKIPTGMQLGTSGILAASDMSRIVFVKQQRRYPFICKKFGGGGYYIPFITTVSSGF